MDGGRSGSAQLLCALAILVALAAVLVASPGERATAGGDGDGAKGAASLDPDALARISVRSTPAVARRVARIRGLEFKRVPKPEVVDSDYLNRLGEREFERAGGRKRIGADEAAARITGLLAPDEQLESLYGSTGDLAAAAYDTERDRLYVVSDAVVPNRALVEFVLAHELDHALEDERYGLPDIERLDDDAALAQTALTEGSATSVMVDYGASYLSPTELLGATAGVDDGTAGVPKFAVDQLLWTYLQGNDFVAELRGLAGGWKLVDYAIAHREPASTEQILHPTKYVHDERPLPTRVDGTALRQAGWRPADRSVLGEYGTGQMLGVGADKAVALRAAAGWGGDSYELWRRSAHPAGCEAPCRSDLVLAMAWRWDSPQAAAQFGRAVPTYVEQGLGGEAQGRDAWRVEDGYVALAVGGQRSGLVFAPTAALARRVAAQQTSDAATISP